MLAFIFGASNIYQYRKIILHLPCYNATMPKQEYYNEFYELGQQKMNFSFFELRLPDDDPVYILKKVMEELDFSGLLAC